MRISAIWKRIQLIALNIVMQAISWHVVVGLENDWQIYRFTREYTARLAVINWESGIQSVFTTNHVCIYAGTPMMPPRVLASGPKPCGGKKRNTIHNCVFRCWRGRLTKWSPWSASSTKSRASLETWSPTVTFSLSCIPLNNFGVSPVFLKKKLWLMT